jgi:multidrug efflux pump subunit AcrB/ABC-type multidrug transport system ATPase subunit
MVFLVLLMLGWAAWNPLEYPASRLPVELLPPVSGDELYVNFNRPGSEPEVVEREMLLPLEGRVAELGGIDETWAEIRGSGGTFQIRFEPGTDLEIRELELRRLAAELVREQPRGSSINVDAQDLTLISRFAMFVQVTGGADRNSLMDFIEQRVSPRLAAVEGASQVLAGGGAARELTVRVDPDRCAALGVGTDEVIGALNRTVSRLEFLGGVEDEAGRTAVVLDGRPRGVISLGETRLAADRAVLLRHVADVELGSGREEVLFRVNAKPTVGLVVFQEEGANLIQLGRHLRAKLDELREEFTDYGLDFVVNFDAAEVVEEQLSRLKKLAVTGFAIALLVLFLFLRQWRAVLVVAVAVPTSLLTALALLYLAGQSINLITLLGLAVGIGMLVDNSIVVFEAVQRQLERGAHPDAAAENGVRRTVRAILAATATNGIVFLPIVFADFEQSMTRSLLGVLALAILLPMLASVLVAIGLVPLLARRLAAPAAVARLAAIRRRRSEMGGFTPPDRVRELFGGLMIVALRRPAGWLTGVIGAVLLTVVIAIPWVAVGTATQEPPEAEQVRFSLEIESGGSLERGAGVVERLERAAMALDGVELVESVVREEGGSLTVHLLPKEERAADVNAARVRQVVQQTASELADVEIQGQQSAFGGGGGGGGRRGGGGLSDLLGQSGASVVLSGPDAAVLDLLGEEIEEQLQSIPEIGSTSIEGRAGLSEIRVLPDVLALQGFGLTADQVVPSLNLVGREGVAFRTGFTLQDGREIPLVVRRETRGRGAWNDLNRLRLTTPVGVLPLPALADVTRMPAPPPILHHDGRREIEVTYRLGAEAPKTGPAREAVEEQIRAAIQRVHRPTGYTVETPQAAATFSWFKKILVPIVLLLFAVLAVTFESLTLPLLVLAALPLTVLGASWALVVGNMPADVMALVGIVALIGITVNPAILLVDRMQQRAWRGGMSAGAAALAAVRERTRPVLMTAATTIAGLVPLAIPKGLDNEIWPPFATVMIGGLLTSTLLTLLVVPMGFVFLNRLDRLFGRLGPWVLIGWFAATASVMTPLIVTEAISSLTWQIVATILVAALLLGSAVLVVRKPEISEPEAADGPPRIEVRFLNKIYGRPGPVGRAWRSPQRFARRVLAAGGTAFDPWVAGARVLPLALVLGAALYLTASLQTVFWRVIFAFAAAAIGGGLLRQLRAWRGRADAVGRVDPGGVENVAAALLPWAAMAWIAMKFHVLPQLAEVTPDLRRWVPITLAVVLLIVQLGRYTAVRLSRGDIRPRLDEGWLRRSRTLWRRLSRVLFGLDLPREEVAALRGVQFEVRGGMVGILGPNGAGKTTLLRMLTGILEPSSGNVVLGGVAIRTLKRYLARWIGYLPQDFGLPKDLTAREYLQYWALLYEIRPAEERNRRVQRLLDEVGLGKRADERIGGYSGGMRQRVAVARTLLRLPPVIVVDEPTVGLDPRERIRFRNLLARLSEGRVVLFSTHVVEDVEVACERVIVLARGRVVFDGQPLDLAGEAEGKVWTLRLPPGEETKLGKGASVVDQVPEGDGLQRLRVLAQANPGEGAVAAAPTLQDGYLWLVGRRGEA